AAPIGGVWALDKELVWVSAYAIRFGDRIVGYLVHGYRLEQQDLDAIHQASGASGGVIIGEQVVRASPGDATMKKAFEEASRSKASGPIRFTIGQETFAGRVRVVEGSLPPTEFVWLRQAQGTPPEYEILGYLIWVPVLAALAFALMFGFQRRR